MAAVVGRAALVADRSGCPDRQLGGALDQLRCDLLPSERRFGLPPTLARLRTWTEPTSPALSVSPSYSGPIPGATSRSRALTAAPIRRPLFVSSTRSASRPLKSTTQRGLSSPFFICGSRSVPPAT